MCGSQLLKTIQRYLWRAVQAEGSVSAKAWRWVGVNCVGTAGRAAGEDPGSLGPCSQACLSYERMAGCTQVVPWISGPLQAQVDLEVTWFSRNHQRLYKLPTPSRYGVEVVSPAQDSPGLDAPQLLTPFVLGLLPDPWWVLPACVPSIFQLGNLINALTL